jgi:anti-sigma B factor antagonist
MLSPKVKVTSAGDVRVIAPRGEFIGGNETDELRTALAREAEAGTRLLLVDLAEARYLNSTALGVLIAAHTNMTKRGGRMGLCNVSKSIENLFVITKLVLVFNVYGSVEEGLEGMRAADTQGADTPQGAPGSTNS